MDVDLLSLDGSAKGRVALPGIFESEVRPDLIRRAVLAEQSLALQPQGHYVLAGMQTSAKYYGAMHSYRTGRHTGRAIRPRQKLGGGMQGQVRRIPSAVKGKRAHPHMVGKALVERINVKEYRKGVACAIAATAALRTGGGESARRTIVLSNEIEKVKRTAEMVKVFNNLKLIGSKRKRIRKGLRRGARQRRYGKGVLLVVGSRCDALLAARNIAGVDACDLGSIRASLFAPGGNPGRQTVWSESALLGLESAINAMRI